MSLTAPPSPSSPARRPTCGHLRSQSAHERPAEGVDHRRAARRAGSRSAGRQAGAAPTAKRDQWRSCTKRCAPPPADTARLPGDASGAVAAGQSMHDPRSSIGPRSPSRSTPSRRMRGVSPVGMRSAGSGSSRMGDYWPTGSAPARTERSPAILARDGLVGCCFGLFAFLGQSHTAEPFTGMEFRSWPPHGGHRGDPARHHRPALRARRIHPSPVFCHGPKA